MTFLIAENIAVRAGGTQMVAPVSLRLEAGKAVTLIGETGSGKSLCAQALLGLLPRGLSASGSLSIHGRSIDVTDKAAFEALWGRDVSVLPQEPWLALNPLKRATGHVEEVYRLVARDKSPAEKARSDLAAYGLAHTTDAFPFELSGGMAQRLAIAAARAGGAGIIVADEPTKGLDVARRDDVARQMQQVIADGGALLTVTHDLELAAALGGEIFVFRDGAVVESGPATQVLTEPAEQYTRELVAADPRNWATRSEPGASEAVLQCKSLSVARGDKVLLENLDLTLHRGEILGLYGPSGTGKSSLGDTLLGLLTPRSGEITYAPNTSRRRFQKLYQDPPSAFPATQILGQGLNDLIRLHRVAADSLPSLLDRLHLRSDLLDRLPSEVSGGELQRLAIARALLLDPVFLFADEPTSRLDPLTQKSVIDLLIEVARERGIAILLVSHDPALIAKATDGRVAVSFDHREADIERSARGHAA